MDDTIEIRDETYILKEKDIPKHVLYVDGTRVGYVTLVGGAVQMGWEIYGPQYWPDAKAMLQGLMELGCVADQLSVGLQPTREGDE
jgi:hypothetical protein